MFEDEDDFLTNDIIKGASSDDEEEHFDNSQAEGPTGVPFSSTAPGKLPVPPEYILFYDDATNCNVYRMTALFYSIPCANDTVRGNDGGSISCQPSHTEVSVTDKGRSAAAIVGPSATVDDKVRAKVKVVPVRTSLNSVLDTSTLSLPDQLLNCIFSYLDQRAQSCCHAVCYRWAWFPNQTNLQGTFLKGNQERLALPSVRSFETSPLCSTAFSEAPKAPWSLKGSIFRPLAPRTPPHRTDNYLKQPVNKSAAPQVETTDLWGAMTASTNAAQSSSAQALGSGPAQMHTTQDVPEEEDDEADEYDFLFRHDISGDEGGAGPQNAEKEGTTKKSRGSAQNQRRSVRRRERLLAAPEEKDTAVQDGDVKPDNDQREEALRRWHALPELEKAARRNADRLLQNTLARNRIAQVKDMDNDIFEAWTPETLACRIQQLSSEPLSDDAMSQGDEEYLALKERVDWRRKRQRQNEAEEATLQRQEGESEEAYLWRRLNVSHDDGRLYRGEEDWDEEMEHSVPALELQRACFPPKVHCHTWHRPRVTFMQQAIIPIQCLSHRRLQNSDELRLHLPKLAPSEARGGRGMAKTIETLDGLSALRDELHLQEFIEATPALVNNIGMATHICNYYRKADVNEVEAIPTPAMGRTPIILEPNASPPVFIHVPPRQLATTTENQMYKAQIYPAPLPKTSDFLLIVRHAPWTLKDTSIQAVRGYIRPLPAVFVKGHQQPQPQCGFVPEPKSVPDKWVQRMRIQVHIIRHFLRTRKVEDTFDGKLHVSTTHRLKLEEVRKEVEDDVPEGTIRRALKQCAQYHRAGGESRWWTIRPDYVFPSEYQIRRMLTPEQLCAYESTRCGQQRLSELFQDSPQFLDLAATRCARFGGNKELVAASHYVKRRLSEAPWCSTRDYLNAVQTADDVTAPLLDMARRFLDLAEYRRVATGMEERRVPSPHQAPRPKSPTGDPTPTTRWARAFQTMFEREAAVLSGKVPYCEVGVAKGWEQTHPTKDKDDDEGFDEMFESFKGGFEDAEKARIKAEQDSLADLLADLSSLSAQRNLKREQHIPSDVPLKKGEKRMVRIAIRTSVDPNKPGGVIREIIRDPARVAELAQLEELRDFVNEYRPRGERRVETEDPLLAYRSSKAERRSADRWRRFRKGQEAGRLKVCLACGRPGHAASSRLCPYFGQKDKFKKDWGGESSSSSGSEESAAAEPVPSGPPVSPHSSSKVTLPSLSVKMEALAATQQRASLAKAKIVQGRQEQEWREKQRTDYLIKPTATFRRITPLAKASEILKQVLAPYLTDPKWKAFQTPVHKLMDKEQFREYKKRVREPMDLSTVSRMVHDLQVTDVDSFLESIHKISVACRLYWGPTDDLARLAIQLEEALRHDVEARREEINALKEQSSLQPSTRRSIALTNTPLRAQPPPKKQKRQQPASPLPSPDQPITSPDDFGRVTLPSSILLNAPSPIPSTPGSSGMEEDLAEMAAEGIARPLAGGGVEGPPPFAH